jgi:Rad3-related DNA helicase
LNFKSQNFPFQIPRNEQITAIDIAINAFINSDKRFFILEAGTGIGKSGIAVTVAREIEERCNPGNYLPGSYFITTQKLLQNQYIKDFGSCNKPVLNLMGSVNYTCSHNKYAPLRPCQKMIQCLLSAQEIVHTRTPRKHF